MTLLIGIGIGTATKSSKKTTVASAASNTTFATAPDTFAPDTASPDTTPPITDAPTTDTTPPPSLKVGNKASYDDGSSIQIYTYTQGVPSTNSFETPKPAMEYAVIDVQFCAGTASVSYNDLGFSAQTADNRQYGGAFATVKDPDLGSGDLPSGCKRGYVTLEVPKGQRPTEIVWNYSSWPQTTWNVG